jgi:hypothetical protein
VYILCNGGQHYVPYRWLLISNKLCDSTLCTCGGVGVGEEQVHNVDYDPVNFKRPYFHLVMVMEPKFNYNVFAWD